MKILKHQNSQLLDDLKQLIIETRFRVATNEEKNLRRMIQFAEKFSDFEKVVTLSRQLSWSHFLILIPLKAEAMEFYSKLVYNNSMGVRKLRELISVKTFERAENVNLQLQNTSMIEPWIFKDPYFLDFLQLHDGYLENDLESAILRDLEQFILELGNGFTFVERQKRIIVDGEDFHLDLLFFHRKLKRLVAIELKIDRNPYSGPEKPEALKYKYEGYWSLRITNEHRLIYRVKDEEIHITKCRFHYD